MSGEPEIGADDGDGGDYDRALDAYDRVVRAGRSGEPICLHPGCVLDHPHAGPVALTAGDGAPQP